MSEPKEQSSWADTMENEENCKTLQKLPLPSPTVVIKDNIKIVTEYKYDEDGRRVKVVRTYRIETRKVSKSVAERRTWAKFGASANDKPGPNPATTIVSDEIVMKFLLNNQYKAKDSTFNTVDDKAALRCEICEGHHHKTVKCPNKVTAEKDFIPLPNHQQTSHADDPNIDVEGKYIPPHLKYGTVKKDETILMPSQRNRWTIRLSNLPENTLYCDVDDLVKNFGKVLRIFVVKNGANGLCKGFAYATYKSKTDAMSAIKYLNGHRYGNLILKVELSM